MRVSVRFFEIGKFTTAAKRLLLFVILICSVFGVGYLYWPVKLKHIHISSQWKALEVKITRSKCCEAMRLFQFQDYGQILNRDLCGQKGFRLSRENQFGRLHRSFNNAHILKKLWTRSTKSDFPLSHAYAITQLKISLPTIYISNCEWKRLLFFPLLVYYITLSGSQL